MVLFGKIGVLQRLKKFNSRGNKERQRHRFDLPKKVKEAIAPPEITMIVMGEVLL